ncbi:hypothetical protein LTR02_011162 [Friedmanniomyces endolithicus]|nr:hypothetical protein LTR02_011162 [Friedmanniomyces endolithicus]
MSSERSSSAVRNLRSIFEVKGPDTSSPDTRGRSRSGLTESNNENSRPTSKVRASFVPVETTPSASVMASTEEGGLGNVMPGGKRESSAGLRRSSFSENGEDGKALLQLRKTVSQEAERRERDSKVPEAIPEHAATSAAVTPMMQPNTEQSDDVMQESPLAHKSDAETATPGKPTAAAGDSKKPHTPERKMAAVSRGDAEKTKQPENEASHGIKAHEASASAEPGSATKKSKRAEQQPKSKPTTNGRPTPISTKAAQKPSSSAMKSPASQPKTPSSAKATTPSKTATPPKTLVSAPTEKKQPSKKASRSSLTAPTAASVARAAAPDRSVSNSSKQSPPSKAKARQGTKPVDLPSRLTAPTAASRAKHDAAPAPSNGSAVNGKPPTTTRPKPQPAFTRPTPRSSMQRPDSRASHPNKKPAAAPADGSFLERMMRPTAASSSKTHDKVEAKSPPRTKPAATVAKPKVNGHAKRLGEKTGKGSTEAAQPAQEGGAEGGGGGWTSGKDAGEGIETPVSQINGTASSEDALETPAFGGGETIR